jgi:predicted ferric reductase
MKTRTVLTLFIGLLTAVWAWDALVVNPMQGDWLWLVRQQGMYLSGLLSIGLMSLAMVLATRPAWLETPLGGMDKIYRLHKWAGILAISAAGGHWLFDQAGGVVRDLIGKAGKPAKEPLLALLQPTHSLAKDMGEWGFYVLVFVLVISLWKRFPYRPWQLLHKAMPVLYLLLAFHSVTFMPVSYWSGPTGMISAVLLAGGTLASAIALAQRIGVRRRHSGRIEQVTQHGSLLEVVCDPGSRWPGHRAGQFAFVTFDHLEGAHPFTIASAWEGSPRRVVFQIKALGDYTRTLAHRLHAGQAVRIEGPYGRLDYQRGRRNAHQVWVAAGVGVTPFLAWLESMQHTPTDTPIQMHYSTRHAQGDPLVQRVRQLCDALPNVTLQIHDASHRQRLDVHALLAGLKARGGKQDIWFCGPSGLGRSLRKGMKHLGLRRARLHQEAFEMR